MRGVQKKEAERPLFHHTCFLFRKTELLYPFLHFFRTFFKEDSKRKECSEEDEQHTDALPYERNIAAGNRFPEGSDAVGKGHERIEDFEEIRHKL